MLTPETLPIFQIIFAIKTTSNFLQATPSYEKSITQIYKLQNYWHKAIFFERKNYVSLSLAYMMSELCFWTVLKKTRQKKFFFGLFWNQCKFVGLWGVQIFSKFFSVKMYSTRGSRRATFELLKIFQHFASSICLCLCK